MSTLMPNVEIGGQPLKFVIITPTRNEEQFIETTIRCMARQTHPPLKWVIVNDGSNDGTATILDRAAREVSFISVLHLPDRGYRKPGQGVIEVFYEGYKKIEGHDYDVLAKFDADLEFEPGMLERIGREFMNNDKLGITGGTIYTAGERGLVRDAVPDGFVQGAVKFYRAACFRDIDGLICRSGWDGVDNIRANMHGWDTYEIRDLKVIHLRPTGTASGEGEKRACMKYGDVSYYMGGYFWYFLLRVVGRSLAGRSWRPGYYMLKGYWHAWKARSERATVPFRKYLKSKQLSGIRNMLPYALTLIRPGKNQ